MCLYRHMTLHALLDELRRSVRDLDGSTISGSDAAKLVDQFAEVERLAVAGRTLAAARVQQTKSWRASGSPSIVAWMADHSRSSFRHAASTLNMAMRLEQLPATREALVSGHLSERQASEISAAAELDPMAEKELLKMAAREGITALREKCRDVAAAAAGDENARERIRRSRYFRHWLEGDGALRLDARLTADEGAPLLATIRARADSLEAEARKAGHAEAPEAHAADALVSLADGAGAPKTVVHVHVSQGALDRGHTRAGETCRIPGVGPITVDAARRLASSGSMKILETDGVDVHRVAHAGRTISAPLRTALEARDPTCVVPGCNKRRNLEIDHIVPFATGGKTTLDNLARLCKWHHAQKTHHGWRLEGVPGVWSWVRTGSGVEPLARAPSGPRP
jgi:hypothetical protein